MLKGFPVNWVHLELTRAISLARLSIPFCAITLAYSTRTGFRIGAGASEKEHKIYFSGGSDSVYDYNGIGYDGHPAEPSPVTFAFDVHSGQWETVNEDTSDATMDLRGLLVAREGLVLLGGMEKGQQVSAVVKVVHRK